MDVDSIHYEGELASRSVPPVRRECANVDLMGPFPHRFPQSADGLESTHVAPQKPLDVFQNVASQSSLLDGLECVTGTFYLRLHLGCAGRKKFSCSFQSAHACVPTFINDEDTSTLSKLFASPGM